MLKANLQPAVKIDPNNYENLIKGAYEENIFCAFLGLIADPEMFLTAKEWVTFYRAMVSWVFGGVKIELKSQPHLEGTKILEDIHTLRGKRLCLFDRLVFQKIVAFLSGDNTEFCKEADNEFTKFEAKLLFRSFMP